MTIEELVHGCISAVMKGLCEQDVDMVVEMVGMLGLNESELGETFICSAALMLATAVFSCRMEQTSVEDDVPSPNLFKRVNFNIEYIIDCVQNGENPFEEKDAG